MEKKTIIIVFSLLLSVANIYANDNGQWTLKDCIAYAMSNNISIKKTKLQRQTITEDLNQSKAALFPSLSASTGQSLTYRPWPITGQHMVNNGTVESSIDKFYYNGTYNIGANWTVWNGNKNTNTIKLNRLNKQQAEYTETETANSIQEKIIQLYVQILYQAEAIKVNEQSYTASKKNEERGTEMLKIGKMSKADLAQLSAQTAQDHYNMVVAQNNLAAYKLQLKQLLEISDDQQFDIETRYITPEQVNLSIPSIASVYEAALLTRPEIQSSKLAIESSNLNLKIAKAGLLPTLSVSATLGTSSSSISNYKWNKQMKSNLDVGIGATLTIPIFDNRQNQTAINKAKIEQQNTLLDLQDTQKQLYSTIETYWLDANTNQQQYKAAQASVKSQQKSYELLSEQFRLGLKNIVELMNGKTNLLIAEQNMLQSKYLTILNIQLLEFYKGKPITD